MALIEKRVDGICPKCRDSDVANVAECFFVIFLSPLLVLGENVFIFMTLVNCNYGMTMKYL